MFEFNLAILALFILVVVSFVWPVAHTFNHSTSYTPSIYTSILPILIIFLLDRSYGLFLSYGWVYPYVIGRLSGLDCALLFFFFTASNWKFVILLSIVVPLFTFFYLLVGRSAAVFAQSTIAIGGLLIVGVVFITTDSLFFFFFSFELILLVSLFLLRLTSKSERVLESIAEMAAWTLFGSLFLLAGFASIFLSGYTSLSDLSAGLISQIQLFFFIVGFGVKIPVWPFTAWLLKAHVEASTEFSILLSGVILKFGVYGVYTILNLATCGVTQLIFAAVSIIGMLDGILRILSQRDLKRIVALTTVIELNWVAFCLAVGGGLFDHTALIVSLAHSYSTALEFYIVDCLYRRFGTRDVAALSGIYAVTPLLFIFSLLTVMVTIGFPGTSIFISKFFFFSILPSYSLSLFFVLSIAFFFILPLVFIRLWVPIWFGHTTVLLYSFDLTLKDAMLLLSLLCLTVALGVSPSLFL